MTTLAHDYTEYIADAWETYFSSAVFSGIVGDPAHQQKNSYHNSLEDNPDQDGYSNNRPDDAAPPGTWPRNLAAAIDMSMSSTDMKLCCDRLWGVWDNRANDPRAAYVNAFNGWFNEPNVPAKRYDYYSGAISETSSDHKWHVHLEIRRKWVTDMNAANAILSMLRGETVEQYLQGTGGSEEDMYAKKGMGLNGSPISHMTMYLQSMLAFLRPESIGHSTYPMTVDGKYGSNTAYWVSVELTGGAGDIVDGAWFAELNRRAAARVNGGVTLPDSIRLDIPGTSIQVPGTVIEIPPTSVVVDVTPVS